MQTLRTGPVFWGEAFCVSVYSSFDFFFTDVGISLLATNLIFSCGLLKIYFNKHLIASYFQSTALWLEALGVW